ncbi:MAG: thioredoxin [Nanoarchaeota archaeon]|nr:thioredoxin [Nanoarchaeota archaeon]MBU1704214.1 thioredoxin [Nanoarchaeota archaeon]
MVEILDKENFDKFIAEGTTIVDFWASWCGPCQMMGPVFEAVSKEVKGAKFGKLSTEEAPDIAGEHQISSIPCLIIFKDGKESSRIIGYRGKDELKEEIEQKI